MHEIQRRHHDMVGTVAVWALESRFDISGAVEFEPFIGDGGAGDVVAQLLQFLCADSWEYLKFVTNLATPTVPQVAVAGLLGSGAYERHLRKVRS